MNNTETLSGLDTFVMHGDTHNPYAFLFEKKRIGLITNPSGITRTFESSIEVLSRIAPLYGGELMRLFSPEHGVRGNVQAGEFVEVYMDEETSIPVKSLYGKHHRPHKEDIADLDLVAFDIQDAGVRYYTYLYTLTRMMHCCAECGIPLLVFDRPNPLGGNIVEGITMQNDCVSFVGEYPLPQRYGLTIGEFAQWVNKTYIPNAVLHIIPLSAWKRSFLFPHTHLPWVPLSPNIPTFNSLLFYTMTHLFEGTNVSEGRGTTRPFEYIGSPWIQGTVLAEKMNSYHFESVYFRPVYFTPCFSKYTGILCSGVHVHHRKEWDNPCGTDFLSIGVTLVKTIQELYPTHFQFLNPLPHSSQAFINLLFGSSLLKENNNTAHILSCIAVDSKIQQAQAQSFFLYEDE